MNRWRGLTLLLLFSCTALQAADFSFSRVLLSELDGQLTLDADISYALSDEAQEALQNGVPLTFVTHIEIRDNAAWIWQPDLIERRLRSTLTYHPLSALYELHQLDSGDTQQFATRDAALRALGELRALQLIPSSELRRGASYTVRLDTYLDLEALPLTLRPLAHLTPAWHLDSDPWEQSLTP
jgi:hypothetical protein